jgi:Txe/YoeB family toxin of Txe-Axe toxin-antitoxin module
MKQPSEVRFADSDLKKAFEALKDNADEKWLFKAIRRTINELEGDAFSGIQLSKHLIPKKYGVDNLWKCNLPDGWRLLYSVTREEIIVISIILEWLDHKAYERRFGYAAR